LRDIRRTREDGQSPADPLGDRREKAANIATNAEGSDQPGVEGDLVLDS
jgi:hypothetical protein